MLQDVFDADFEILFFFFLSLFHENISVLQIRRGNWDNLETIINISKTYFVTHH